tara:strand:+ start:1116 stop:1586 length:471 start_codon:yes stop_codon:yes gene_type:complete
MGVRLVRAKEVERRLGIARAAHCKAKREGKRAVRMDQAWGAAGDALNRLEALDFNLPSLKRGELEALVRALDVGKVAGNKSNLAKLLSDRFGEISRAQFEVIKATVARGSAVAMLPPPPQPSQAPSAASTEPLALPEPSEGGMPAERTRSKRQRLI